jgi:hypothetical protein
MSVSIITASLSVLAEFNCSESWMIVDAEFCRETRFSRQNSCAVAGGLEPFTLDRSRRFVGAGRFARAILGGWALEPEFG